VMANTVGISCLGETSIHLPKGQSKHSNGGVKQRQGIRCLAPAFHRVGPLAGLTVALVATVGWIGLLGYVEIKLF